jgi:hypothetical protein
MDASKITAMLQKQNNVYINRCNTVDSSTLTWRNQIRSSKYIINTPNCDNTTTCTIPTQTACSTGNGICNYGGGMSSNITLITGSPQQYPNPLHSSKGSASNVYSSDNVLLQKAGKNDCGVSSTSPAPENSYVLIDPCYCKNSNAPDSETGVANTNPYLPQFDQYYAMKYKLCGPCVEPPHFVKKCGNCTLEN